MWGENNLNVTEMIKIRILSIHSQCFNAKLCLPEQSFIDSSIYSLSRHLFTVSSVQAVMMKKMWRSAHHSFTKHLSSTLGWLLGIGQNKAKSVPALIELTFYQEIQTPSNFLSAPRRNVRVKKEFLEKVTSILGSWGCLADKTKLLGRETERKEMNLNVIINSECL